MRLISKFKRKEEGTILVFVALCLVVIVGMTALSFDLGRMASTQTDLQAYTDHVALAAAGELDGTSDAIVRANAAAANMIRDTQLFATGSQDLDSAADYSLRFLTGLPDATGDPDDNAAVDAFLTTDPTEASMVEVTATPRTVFLPFANALSDLLGVTRPGGQVEALAIAGYTQYACDIAPLMFCVPDGWTADPDVSGNAVGSTVLLRTGGPNSLWEPGNFGFLQPNADLINPMGPCADSNGNPLTGNALYICLVAANGSLIQCVPQGGVDTEPGQKNGITSAIYNSRFDIFTATMSQLKSDDDYAPGPNTINGWENTGGGCLKNNPDLSTNSMPYPPDDCFDSADGLCDGSRFGDAAWSTGKANYLDTNYGDGPDGTLTPHPDAPGLITTLNLNSTRYQMYLDEIALSRNPDGTLGDILVGRSETGLPQCHNSVVDDAERRTFIAAAVNCQENPISGRTYGVPVQEFVKIFLMQPLESSSGSDFDIYVEVVEKVGGTGFSSVDAKFREVVRLYR